MLDIPAISMVKSPRTTLLPLNCFFIISESLLKVSIPRKRFMAHLPHGASARGIMIAQSNMGSKYFWPNMRVHTRAYFEWPYGLRAIAEGNRRERHESCGEVSVLVSG